MQRSSKGVGEKMEGMGLRPHGCAGGREMRRRESQRIITTDSTA